MLRRLSYLILAIGLIFLGILGYFEVIARYSQFQMRNEWRSRGPTKKQTGNPQAGQRLLGIEKRGPNKNELGVLIIPKIGLEQVVLYDAKKENLDRAPSVIKGTAYPGTRGNSAIAGHRTTHGFPFRNLDKLKRGDRIIFENGSGRLTYKVTRKFRVKPNYTKILWKRDYPRITLLTCDPPLSAAYRLVVVGRVLEYQNTR